MPDIFTVRFDGNRKPMKLDNNDQYKTQNFFLKCTALSGMLAVMLGAFGAHGLKNHLSPILMQAYQTSVQYHFIHTLALGLTVLVMQQRNNVWIRRSAWCFLLGTVLFSGSLYGLALSGIRALGMVTPFGGVLFIAAWLFLFISTYFHDE